MVDLAKIVWPAPELVERHLLPHVCPAPKGDVERAAMVEALTVLFRECYDCGSDQAFLAWCWRGRGTAKEARAVKKAARLLEETALGSLKEKAKELHAIADEMQGWCAVPAVSAERLKIITKCRDFLKAHGKHAGIKDAGYRQGKAILLALAVIELASEGGHRTAAMRLRASGAALSMLARRGGDIPSPIPG